ncbi:MAG: pirin family protein [Chitinophagaceae bacterium]|nr:MAG: pirin family protein [Chitinophagaceae bacterium]
MKKKSSFSTKGKSADIGDIKINRILPNRYADAVGPFVFLDHILPTIQKKKNQEGTGAHPHRGIATLTYLLNGEAAHFDSAGNAATVHSGGIQWMKAGNGIIHDETLNADSLTDSDLIHAFQFWVNLPSVIKAEKPAYLSIEGNDVQHKTLPGGDGWIKVIAGTYEDLQSLIPAYSEQLLYHIHLEPGAKLSIDFAEKLELAAFPVNVPAMINDEQFDPGEFIEFDRKAGSLEFVNTNPDPSDIVLFGGAPYEEPIVAHGPFVMNTSEEIGVAYQDYTLGKYGTIDYRLTS